MFRRKGIGVERPRHVSTGGGPALALSVLFAFTLVACGTGLSWQEMARQPRYEPFEQSDFFPDGQSARPAVPGTMPRGLVQDDELLFTGKVGAADATVLPMPVDLELLERGQERFNIYCSPCHGQTGYGNGLVVQRGFSAPPSFHVDRLRAAPVGHYFNVITNGFGAMPSYGDEVQVRDRWAIIAYIRALQLSQNATIDDVPPGERDKLGGQ